MSMPCLFAGLEAMEAALALEKKVNQSLLDLHKTADNHNDYQVGLRSKVNDGLLCEDLMVCSCELGSY